ncbi:MAG TPA: M23 family metallopeptidase [Allocoleopsis sp.]
MPKTEPRTQDDPGFILPGILIDEYPTPARAWVDEINQQIETQIQAGVDRAIEPIAQLSEQVAAVQQSIESLSEVERARVERRSILIGLWVLLLGVVWIQLIHPLMKGMVQVGQTIGTEIKKGATGEGVLENQKCIRMEFPSTGQKTSDFGERESPGGIGSTDHKGIDLAADEGTPVTAAAAGKVTHAGDAKDGYGNSIVISHGTVDGHPVETLYGHLKEIQVKEGDLVSPTQLIGTEGSTGNSTGPHLHFGVKLDGQWVDPETFLSKDFCPGAGK